jgi:peroxiredoxin (alkyl hydroperoxide reductase subunit C)
MSLVGKKAPLFKAPAVVNGHEIVNDFTLEQYIGKQYVVFYFYPKDFTFVCPTEILAFQKKLDDFQARNVAVVGCSTDTEETHLAWLMTPKNKGGIEGVKYPLVADSSKTIASNFGVLAGDWDYNEDNQLIFTGTPVAYRGSFLIDKNGVVRHQVVNDLPLGRNIQEMIRMVDSLQHVEKYGEVCPADWQEGEEAMSASREGVSDYLSIH